MAVNLVKNSFVNVNLVARLVIACCNDTVVWCWVDGSIAYFNLFGEKDNLAL